MRCYKTYDRYLLNCQSFLKIIFTEIIKCLQVYISRKLLVFRKLQQNVFSQKTLNFRTSQCNILNTTTVPLEHLNWNTSCLMESIFRAVSQRKIDISVKQRRTRKFSQRLLALQRHWRLPVKKTFVVAFVIIGRRQNTFFIPSPGFLHVGCSQDVALHLTSPAREVFAGEADGRIRGDFAGIKLRGEGQVGSFGVYSRHRRPLVCFEIRFQQICRHYARKYRKVVHNSKKMETGLE